MGATNIFAIFLLTDSALHWLIVLTVIAVPSIAYAMTAFKGAFRRVGFIVLALLFVFFAYIWTLAYAIPAAEDFKHFALKIWLPGAVFDWIIAVAAWAFAVRFVLRGIRVPR